MSRDLIRTDQTFTESETLHYPIVVLRDDQLVLIREIVREEIRKALAE